jgi:hypothetical protein
MITTSSRRNWLAVSVALLSVAGVLLVLRCALYYFPLLSLLLRGGFRIICSLYVGGTLVASLFVGVRRVALKTLSNDIGVDTPVEPSPLAAVTDEAIV